MAKQGLKDSQFKPRLAVNPGNGKKEAKWPPSWAGRRFRADTADQIVRVQGGHFMHLLGI